MVKRLLKDLGNAYFKPLRETARVRTCSGLRSFSWTVQGDGSSCWRVNLISDDTQWSFKVEAQFRVFETPDTSEQALKSVLREAFQAGPALE